MCVERSRKKGDGGRVWRRGEEVGVKRKNGGVRGGGGRWSGIVVVVVLWLEGGRVSTLGGGWAAADARWVRSGGGLGG